MNDEQPSNAVALRPEPESMGMVNFSDEKARRRAIDDVIGRAVMVGEIMEKVMKPEVHYGKIPGCGDKAVLLKAGAEKLGMTFRLIPQFTIDERQLANEHREYRVTCILSDGTHGVGTCSTMESKYRYRQADRQCPKCGKYNIIAGKAEYGGGWLCFAKKGGCGEKFAFDDPKIASQQVGKVEHDNPADFWNTCLKMGKKRAHVDAVITATATSDVLTQDLDEMEELLKPNPVATEKKEKKEKAPAQQQQPPATNGKKGNSLLSVLKASKDKLLEQVEPMAAWVYCVRSGYIMDNETLDAAKPERLFGNVDVTKDLESNKPAIKKDAELMLKDIKLIEPTAEETQKFADAYAGKRKKAAPAQEQKPIEVPRDPEAAWKEIPIPAWSKHVKQDGFKTFGDLPKNLLWWWCCSWVPQGYQGKPPGEEEVKLRKILDVVKGNYDFEARESDSGAAPGSAAATPPPVEDDVPF